MESSCPKCGADREKTKYTPTRLVGGESVFGDAYTCGCRVWRDNKITPAVNCLRRQLAAANAKLAEMARLAEDSAKAANELVDSPWRTDEFGDEGVVLLWDGECAVSAELGPGFYDTSKSRNFGNPTHWMPLPQPPKEADDDDA